MARSRAGYAALKYAFLPCVISTSGRLRGELLRLLYILAHRRTSRWRDYSSLFSQRVFRIKPAHNQKEEEVLLFAIRNPQAYAN